MCDPMTYPFLLPNGEQGWNCNLPLRKKDGTCEMVNEVQDDPYDGIVSQYNDDSHFKKNEKLMINLKRRY